VNGGKLKAIIEANRRLVEVYFGRAYLLHFDIKAQPPRVP